MELNEWKQCIAILKCAYTRKEFLPDKEAAMVWFGALNDIPYDLIQKGIASYIKTNHFEPTISDLREQAFKIETDSSNGDEMQAWSEVGRAMKNSAYNSVEEFKKLSPVIQQCIGSPATLKEWALTDYDSMPVIQSQFLRTYRARIIEVKNNCITSNGFSAMLETKADKTELIADKRETERSDFVAAPEELLKNLRRSLGAQ